MKTNCMQSYRNWRLSHISDSQIRDGKPKGEISVYGTVVNKINIYLSPYEFAPSFYLLVLCTRHGDGQGKTKKDSHLNTKMNLKSCGCRWFHTVVCFRDLFLKVSGGHLRVMSL